MSTRTQNSKQDVLKKFSCMMLLMLLGSPITHALTRLDELELPDFQLIEHQENWAKMKSVQHDRAQLSILEKIKYIPLSDNQDVWLSFGGEMRDRVEHWNNFGFNPANHGKFNLWRFLPYADLHYGEQLRLFLELKTALATQRPFGGGKRPIDEDQFAIQQAFVSLKLWQNQDKQISMRLGRQEIAFGRYRIITIAPWSNAFRNWDGAVWDYKQAQLDVSLIALQSVQLRPTKYNPSLPDDRLFGLYATKKQVNFKYDLYWLYRNRGNQQYQNNVAIPILVQGSDRRHTFGGRIYNSPKETFNYDVEVAYQRGTFSQHLVSAYMVGSYVSFKVYQLPLNPQLYVMYDYASGGNNSNKVHTFNLLYPAGHMYFGYADHIGRQNIQSPTLGVKVNPNNKWLVGMQYLEFYRANNQDGVYRPSGSLLRNGLNSRAKHIGSEIDLYTKYKINRHWEFLMGYSQFSAGKFIKQTGNSKPIKFAYTQLTVRV